MLREITEFVSPCTLAEADAYSTSVHDMSRETQGLKSGPAVLKLKKKVVFYIYLKPSAVFVKLWGI